MPTDLDNLIHGSMSKDFRRVGTITPDPDNARLADEPIPVEFYLWLASIEPDVRVRDLTADEVQGLIDALRQQVRAVPGGLVAGRHVPNLIDNLRETAIGCDHSNEASLAELCKSAADVIEALAGEGE